MPDYNKLLINIPPKNILIVWYDWPIVNANGCSFSPVWSTVHTNPDKLSTENGTFRKRSSECIMLKTPALRFV